MKLLRFSLLSFSAIFLIFIVISVSDPNKNLLGFSWIDERPSRFISYHFRDGKCFFVIDYMADWKNRISLQEEREVAYLDEINLCKTSFEYLTRTEMYFSVGARVLADGSWEILVDHNGDISDFSKRQLF